ncbi:hypothetical protein BDR26DRAFT_619045 [Obelidium mucronatum]|nr:hypothetical protein BDR26DRAFT_619045 [Obelidium mucronatum]
MRKHASLSSKQNQSLVVVAESEQSTASTSPSNRRPISPQIQLNSTSTSRADESEVSSVNEDEEDDDDYTFQSYTKKESASLSNNLSSNGLYASHKPPSSTTISPSIHFFSPVHPTTPTASAPRIQMGGSEEEVHRSNSDDDECVDEEEIFTRSSRPRPRATAPPTSQDRLHQQRHQQQRQQQQQQQQEGNQSRTLQSVLQQQQERESQERAEQEERDEQERIYGNMPSHLRLALMKKRKQLPHQRRKNGTSTSSSSLPSNNAMNDDDILASGNKDGIRKEGETGGVEGDEASTQSPKLGFTQTLEALVATTNALSSSTSTSSAHHPPEDPSTISCLNNAITELSLLKHVMYGTSDQYFDLKLEDLNLQTRMVDSVLLDPTNTTVKDIETNYKSNQESVEICRHATVEYIESVYQGAVKAAEDSYFGRRKIRDDLNCSLKRKLAELEGERMEAFNVRSTRSDFFNGTTPFDTPSKRSTQNKMCIASLCDPIDQDSIESDISYLKTMAMN